MAAPIPSIVSKESSDPLTAPILLLVDLQHGLIESPEDWGPRSTPNLPENVTHLLSTWRANSWPVLHVHHDGAAPNIISAAYPANFAAHACSAPLPSEPRFVKTVGSPFVETSLQEKIKELGGKRKLVVIGMDGAECINCTTRHAADLGHNVVVVADACATFGMADWRTGKKLGAEETHDAAMSMLLSYADVTTTDKVLSGLGY